MSGDHPWPVLTALVAVAVPARIDQVRLWDEALRTARRKECVGLIASHGDELLFRGKRTREAFAAVVDALALLSFAPGGVPFEGLIFCARHGGVVRPDPCIARCCACLAEDAATRGGPR